MDKGEAIKMAIIFLADPKIINENFLINDVLTDLGIPQELHTVVFQTMLSRGYIKGPLALKNPIVWIDKKGLEYAEQLEEEHFNLTGELFYYNPTNMTLSETCELIFQKHKENEGSMRWHKGIYKEMPRNAPIAKETMIKQDVIYPASNNVYRTILNHDVIEANSYIDAISIIEGKKNPLPPSSIHVGDNFSGNLNTGTVGGNQSSFDKSFNAEINSKEPNEKRKIAWKTLAEIIAGILLIVLAILKFFKII